MPIATPLEARDEILLQFSTVWNAQDDPPPVMYPDKREDLPDNGPYARVTIQHNTAPQVTVGGKTSHGGAGQRFRSFGIVTVQIFTPSGDGLTAAYGFANIALNAFRGQNTGQDRVEFRNARINEVDQDGPWSHLNVLAEFDYDTTT